MCNQFFDISIINRYVRNPTPTRIELTLDFHSSIIGTLNPMKDTKGARLALITIILLITVTFVCVGCGAVTGTPVKEVPWTGEGSPPPPEPGTRWVIPEEPSAASQESSSTGSANPEVLPSEPGSTFEPVIITGSGSNTTPPFTVTTSDWIIDWSYTSDYKGLKVFAFFVYPMDEPAMYVESLLLSQADSGSIYSHAGRGEYYLAIQATNIQSWQIIIRPAP